ncbi:MAG: DNA methyltransferase [Chloroherpetonaceae bacterium]|nr:DNA methyltransferase [Chloroherpetonaceae bacterium]MDW8437406.1 DNA methyltransferase [Chloroherpetonaceae bacterium]
MDSITPTLFENDAALNACDDPPIKNGESLSSLVERLLSQESLAHVKREVSNLRQRCESACDRARNGASELADASVSPSVLLTQLDQILDAQTLERARYYLKRLKKSLTEVKTSAINDLNLNQWQEYDDVLTDSLWLLGKRDSSGAHHAGYWGNFVPEIPRQFFKRYTKKGDWVLDAFLGSGTTLIECRRQGRNGVGVELQPRVASLAESAIASEPNPRGIQTHVIVGDAAALNYEAELARIGIKRVQLLIMHPPYWDIIKFSDDARDLSNAQSLDAFLAMLGKVIDGTYPVLDDGRYFALVIGDKYSGGEWIPLGFYSMQEALKRGYKLKSIIVKNFEETRGKRNQRELWRYRALVGGFYVFKHEYVFLFVK